ncbi:UDP-glycosyltransferase 90A2 [Dichanthelium oligosanthes]|uniref:Glycosyltransferase n=1 Tax=Dichanthelium oligosanthes TaxID=888268 RepID=A0A1E5W6R3_9POAL|nr:UDP-glycosyltransferase 90A2 [Dichanthelium oligosanthes]
MANATATNGAHAMANDATTNGATAAHNGAHGADNGAVPVSGSGRDHVVIFPFMAKGHMLPLLHFATALSVHHGGLHVTLVTTPGNAAFARSRLPASVSIVALPFPSLPPVPAGVESTDALPCPSLHLAFLRATALLRAPFAEFLASLPSPPLALVSDFFLGFTRRAAADAGVRRIVFNGMSCFASAICKALAATPPASFEPGAQLRVPVMPEHVVVRAEEVPDGVTKRADPDNPFTRFFVHEIGDSDVRSWGVLVNSFAALDEDYVPGLESFYEPGARAWLVGPLFLAAGDMLEGEKDQDPEGCLSWLDERAAQPGSVVYISFGTQAHVTDAQLDELVHGLAQSGHPFLWLVRSDTWSPPVDVAPNGRIVRGWIPQRSVLAHEAVGGFVSHCGWNSVMESLAAGKPLLAWPMIAEQHLNARHVANILGVGVRIAVKAGGMGLVGRADVEEKVRELMDADSKAARGMRERAASAQQAAKAAMRRGGSSAMALQDLVEELQRTYGDVVVGKGANGIQKTKENGVRGTK